MKIVFLILIFYFLALLQTSFLVHFPVLERVNLILLIVIILNIFNLSSFLKLKKWSYSNFGIVSAFIGGFFWDIFSEKIIGFHIFVLLSGIIFLKFILNKYFDF